MNVLKWIGAALLVVISFATVIGALLFFAPPPDDYSLGGLNAAKHQHHTH